MNSETMQKLIYELQRHCDKIGREEMAKANKPKPQLLTPTGIKFWVGKSGKVHGLLFNDGKQMLGYCLAGKVFEVESTAGFELKRIQEGLPLTPCKYEELKPGEFLSTRAYLDESTTVMKLPKKDGFDRNVRINNGETVIPYNCIDKPVWKIGK